MSACLIHQDHLSELSLSLTWQIFLTVAAHLCLILLSLKPFILCCISSLQANLNLKVVRPHSCTNLNLSHQSHSLWLDELLIRTCWRRDQGVFIICAKIWFERELGSFGFKLFKQSHRHSWPIYHTRDPPRPSKGWTLARDTHFGMPSPQPTQTWYLWHSIWMTAWFWNCPLWWQQLICLHGPCTTNTWRADPHLVYRKTARQGPYTPPLVHICCNYGWPGVTEELLTSGASEYPLLTHSATTGQDVFGSNAECS